MDSKVLNRAESTTSILGLADEADLWARRDEDPMAREELVNRYLAFAKSVAVRYRSQAESLDDLPAAELALAGSVVFPNVSEGRVLATGVTGADVLGTASVRARNAAVACGIEVDGQRFRPHVTVARTGGRPTELTSWVRLLDTYAGPSWPLRSVEVVASHLGEGPRRAPRYETVASIVL